MKRKEPIRKNLQTVPVYFEDKTETSPEYFRITKFPNQLTSGKNLVKLSGHPTNLAINSIVNFSTPYFLILLHSFVLIFVLRHL